MTSARTCYCKQEGCALREEDNDIGARNENLRPAIVASKKSVVRSGGSGGSPGRVRRNVVDERKSDTGGSIEARARDPVLSPETSTALENAERIINDAKIQLAEVRAASSLDSARRDIDTYVDDPPLDDEVEELFYIRELVASKFQETSYPRRPETSGEENARRVSARRVDLSAPKFRTSQRRRAAARPSLECGADEWRARGRAPLAGAPKDSKDSSPKDSSSKDDDEATPRDSQTARHRRRASSAARSELAHPDDSGVCRIQMGPSVHVDGELTRQDLEDVHISPGPSPIHKRVNAATYVLRHEDAAEKSHVSAGPGANEPTMTPRARRRVRLTSSPREKLEKLIVAEAAVETATTSASRKLKDDISVVENEDSDYERENRKQTEPTTSQVQDGVYGKERRDEEIDLRNAKDAKAPEHLTGSATDERERSNDEVAVGRSESVDIIRDEIHLDNNVETRSTRIFNKKSGVDSPGRPRYEEHVADKIRAKSRGDQSKPPSLGDVSRRASFPRRGNITRSRRTTPSPKQYRTIDEYLSNTFNSRDGPDEPCDVAVEEEEEKEIRRSRLSSDDFPAKDDANEVELYRPRLDQLDSILLSNDKKIERLVRAAQSFAESLSKPEFAKYKSEEDKREPRRAGREEPLTVDSKMTPRGIDRNREEPLEPTTSSSVGNTTSKSQSQSTSNASEVRGASAVDSQETSATKSPGFAKRNVRRRDDRSRNSAESTERPSSDASDASKMSPDEDEAQRPRSKLRSSSEDISTFSNLPPALSSTRTDTQTYPPRQEQIRVAQAKRSASEDRHMDSKSRVTSHSGDSASKSADRKVHDGQHVDDVVARILRGLRDESTDRFVAYILQDERRSIEGRVAKALDESVIAPTTVEKLLVRLQEADSIGDRATRRTETLGVLKDILINVKNRTGEIVDDEAAKSEKKAEKADSRNVSPRLLEEVTLQEEDARQTPARVTSSEDGRPTEGPRDLDSRDEHSPNLPERAETRGSVRSAIHTVPGSRGNSESKRDSRSEDNSLKKISDILSDKVGSPRENSRLSSAKAVVVRLQENHEAEVGDPDAATATFQDGEDNVSEEDHENKSAEIQDDKDQHTNGNIPRTTPSQVDDALLGVPSGTLVVAKEAGEEKEISTEKVANDSVSLKDKKVSPSVSGAEAVKDQSDANPGRSGLVDETPKEDEIIRSLIEESIESLRLPAEKDTHDPRADLIVAVDGKISPVNSCSADSLRDCASLRTLSSAQSDGSPLKDACSRAKGISFGAVREDNSTKSCNEGDDVPGELATNGAVKSRGNGNEESALPRSERSGGNELLRPVVSVWKSLSSSGSSSSVDSAMLGYDGGSKNGAFSNDTRRVETSSEVSHSEGELYMPSSCSYSLGEVRILEKSDLNANSTIERESSVTILVTRNMLTSLNDSSTPLGSSGRI